MGGLPGRAVERMRAAVRLARERNIDFVASGVTYYELLSIVPLTLLAFIVLAAVGGEVYAASLLSRATGLLPSVGQAVVQDVVSSNTPQTGALGGLILVWAALKVFRGFDTAFSELYGQGRRESFLQELGHALLAMLVFAVSVLAVVYAASAAMAISPLSIDVLGTVMTFVALSLIFLPLYYVFTDVDTSVSALLPGVMVAAAGVTLLQALFRVYVAYATASIYGVFGGALLLMVWMYVGNIFILFGAAVNAAHQENAEIPV